MKEKVKNLIKSELTGWKPLEVAWLAIATAIIIGLSIYWGDTVMGIISAATGVACVVCTGKGKLSAYLFGLVNCVLYAIIAFRATYYGETILNVIYYIPMQFIGFVIWSKNMNSETNEVKKVHMKAYQRFLCLFAMVMATFLGGLFLKHLGDAMPFVDSFTTVASVFAMILSVKMFSEQWWIWVAVDVFSVYMWAVNFANGGENIGTLLMWLTYLGNAIIMLVKWEKEAHQNKIKEDCHEI